MAARTSGVLLAVLLLVLLVPPAAAYDEADAGLLWPQVQAAFHLPAQVPPHTQWNGTLVLHPGHRVAAAQYQICRVGNSCFAPPAPATRVGNDTFTFDTRDYTAGGHPVDYQGGWRIGVQWLLTETAASGNGTSVRLLPTGPDASDPSCIGDAMAVLCQERHYLAFDMATEARSTPAQQVPGLLVVLAALAFAGRKRIHA